ncbi:MAG: M28 family peptidase [Planctomycetota bacterium]|nr:M28 family peptidase [Planctomycetota bacterium]
MSRKQLRGCMVCAAVVFCLTVISGEARAWQDSPSGVTQTSAVAASRGVIQAAAIQEHVEWLASPERRGRAGRDAYLVGDYLKVRFEAAGLKPLFENDSFFQSIPGPTREDGTKTRYGRNVAGWIPGSDPQLKDEFIIVSAHYDHLGSRAGSYFPGADDNASGTAMLIEAAEAFAKSGKPTRRSVVFIGFDLEEHLLWGSRWFAAHPPWPIENVKLFMTADMIGRSLGDLPIETVFVMGSEHGVGLDETLASLGSPRDLSIAPLGIDLIGTRSDYGPFRDRKVPFLFFCTGQHPDYHKVTDTPDKIDADQIASIGDYILRVTRHMANSDSTPEWTSEPQPRMAEVKALHRIATLLLEAEGFENLNTLQKFIITQAEVQARQTIDRGTLTDSERTGLIRTAQVLMLSVF